MLRRIVRHLAIKSGEHIGISLLINKRVELTKDSAVSHHLLNRNYSHSFEDFSIMWHESKKYILELKYSLFIMRDRRSMMMMMNCFCGMVDRRKVFSLISRRNHCRKHSPSRISDTPRAGFKLALLLNILH